MQARAAVFHEVGGPDVLRVETVHVPEPQAGEVCIDVAAFGLNRSEALFRQGWHPEKPQLPSRIGYEAAGVIKSVGPGVTDFKVGDRVGTLPEIKLNQSGAYGELMTLPAKAVVHSPAELNDLEAASLWTSYMTAYGGIVDLVAVKPGDYVLITAASSNSALAAIQITAMLGATPIAVTRTRSKAGAIKAFGAAHVVVTDEENLVESVMSITGGKGVNAVFDPVGGPGAAQFVEVAAPYCGVVLYGVLNPEPTPFPLMAALQNNVAFYAYAMYLWDKPERNAAAIAFIRKGVASGQLKPLVGRHFQLDDIAEAARYLDSMAQVGKIVVTP